MRLEGVAIEYQIVRFPPLASPSWRAAWSPAPTVALAPSTALALSLALAASAVVIAAAAPGAAGAPGAAPSTGPGLLAAPALKPRPQGAGTEGPRVRVLGTVQDGGLPHPACDCPRCEAARRDPARRRYVASLAVLIGTTVAMLALAWWINYAETSGAAEAAAVGQGRPGVAPG